MAYVLNPFTGRLDATGVNPFKGVLSSEPLTAIDGDTYILATTGEYFFYFDGSWQLLTTLTVGDSILLETDDYLLLETDFKLLVN